MKNSSFIKILASLLLTRKKVTFARAMNFVYYDKTHFYWDSLL